ncbi:SAF domain-containing protein [Amycolatopsis nigrescens]|uniref:SAF domain-containing protein n=1 Tax=Amycolatopsis nigrescens TaxID=381445 RepID=UPI000362FC54|nr:SAF domain-containing protein [Amycolatopsis nigrescens]
MDLSELPRSAMAWWQRRWPRIRGRPLLLFRRGLAVALLLASAFVAVLPASAGDDPGLPALVSSRDLPAGRTLTAEDLRVVSMPAPLRPEGAFTEPAAVLGRLLTGAARTGEPITDARLIGSGPNVPDTGEPESATVPVRLADPGVAELLRPGVRVDVVTLDAAEQDRRVLASKAAVVTVSTPPEGPQRIGGGTSKGPLVLIAVPVEIATQVAAASLGRPVTVTLR